MAAVSPYLAMVEVSLVVGERLNSLEGSDPFQEFSAKALPVRMLRPSNPYTRSMAVRSII